MTNAVSAALETVECRLKTNLDISDPAVLHKKFLYARQCIGLPTENDDESSSTTEQFLRALKSTWSQLLASQRASLPKCPKDTVNNPRPPFHLNLKRDTDFGGDRECLAVVLQNIAQLITPGGPCTRCRIIRIGSPVYPEVGYLLTHDMKNGNGLRCAFGLRLIMETYKSYLFAPKTLCLPSTCRLHALRFAQEAVSTTRAVLDHPTMPCRCQGTLAYHIEKLNLDLEAFLHVKMFDFYFQAPWTCASHQLDMFEALFYYGIRLFSYRNYLGSVLHTYNALREMDRMQPISLLDSLCDAFGDSLFPGGRPCQRFKACWLRYMGGRLRFHSHNSDHKSGCHSMAIPAHTAKATAGFGLRTEARDSRFEYDKISILYHRKYFLFLLHSLVLFLGLRPVCSRNMPRNSLSFPEL